MVELTQFENVSVFSNPVSKAEAIVYGWGSDWIAQESKSTSTRPAFRKWFARKELAFAAAALIVDPNCTQLTYTTITKSRNV